MSCIFRDVFSPKSSRLRQVHQDLKLQRTLTDPSKFVLAVAWSADGRLAVGSMDKKVYIYGQDHGFRGRRFVLEAVPKSSRPQQVQEDLKLQGTLTDPSKYVKAVAWSADGRLAAVSGDNNVYIYEQEHGFRGWRFVLEAVLKFLE
eukprot:Skav210649  [mRNA]  locus=scaffold2527:52186:54251:+ [translate_table: standard]